MAGTRSQPAHRQVARALGIAIVTGQRAPGELLPAELAFAGEHRVSRSVIREAFRTLSDKGLIESRPKAGTRVRARGAWNLLDPELLGWMFEGAPPLRFVRDLFQLRLIVEPEAAGLAAIHRTASHLARMDAALSAMADHGLAAAAGQAADQNFHRILLEATGNELLVSLSVSVTAAVRWTTYFKYRTSRQPRDPIPQHRALFGAIERADAAAARDAAAALIRQAQRDTEAALGA